MAGKKGKSDSKSQSKGKADATPAPTKKKGAQAISARHILCDKFSQREEALAELRDGKDWREVCVKYSTEKARSGESFSSSSSSFIHTVI
jgi:peptidyl-prolyl cis-trans isomerase NIMA-interacting 4